jgi:hypothetical protein
MYKYKSQILFMLRFDEDLAAVHGYDIKKVLNRGLLNKEVSKYWRVLYEREA